MAAEPVVYRVASFVPSTVTEAAEVYTEQLEEVPYPLGMVETATGTNWPPAGFTGVAADMTNTCSASPNTASLLPQAFNLEWVQGDTAEFQFLFTDVFWTPEDPGITTEGAPEWVETVWNAQVRNPYIYSTYAADYWVPAYGYQYKWWRANSIVAEFDCTADVIEMPDTDPLQWATRVTLTLPADRSADILPGNWYQWDLQTRTVDNVVKTHLRGKSRIVTEWTVR